MARFEDTGSTNRVEIVETDLYIFLENPIFGTGVGGAYELGSNIWSQGNEPYGVCEVISRTRIVGVLAIISLVAMVIVNFRRQKSPLGRAMVAGVAIWCLLFMLNAGMRLAAPSFLVGIDVRDGCYFKRHVNPNGRREIS